MTGIGMAVAPPRSTPPFGTLPLAGATSLDIVHQLRFEPDSGLLAAGKSRLVYAMLLSLPLDNNLTCRDGCRLRQTAGVPWW